MIMGILILKKKYTLEKYISVAMITLGIIICTLMSSGGDKKVPKYEFKSVYFVVYCRSALTVMLQLSKNKPMIIFSGGLLA